MKIEIVKPMTQSQIQEHIAASEAKQAKLELRREKKSLADSEAASEEE